jgi:hypothetical protein
MARLTKHQKGEIVREFHGIVPKTFDVETVSLTRGGVLSKFSRDGNYHQHPVTGGRIPRNEVVIVYGLTDIIETTPQFSDAEYIKRKLAELQEKADAMKKATEKEI